MLLLPLAIQINKMNTGIKFLLCNCVLFSNVTWASTNVADNPEKLYLVVSGVSKHFHVDSKYDNNPLNEKNWGLGLEYHFPSKASEPLHWMVNLGQFRDSLQTNAMYVGGAGFYDVYRDNKYYFQTGIQLALFNSPSYNGGTPFIAAVPAFSFGTDQFATNIAVIPRVPQIIDAGVVYLQFKVKLN